MAEKRELSTETRYFGSEKIKVTYRKAMPADGPETRIELPAIPPAVFQPSVTTLPKGTVLVDNGRPLPCDIVWERDVAVTMRDGITLYTDVFRPSGSDKAPAIISWSPYGKQIPQPPALGVPASAVSGLAKFEGPDPAYWCNHGYAIVNPDARGTCYSEGDLHFWGKAEANDAYDLIEWAASQSWCDGKISISGSSWIGIIQWFVAAQHPPHLVCIAPWEGSIDLYRCDVLRGGIPDIGFTNHIISGMRGKNRVEDMAAMAIEYPLMNGYWEDKSAKIEQITVPAYVVASYGLHHTLDGFRRISSPEKWLRIHNTMEWPDYYTPENVEDLRRFFDHYLKGVGNGWEQTPRVRLSVFDFGGNDQVNRAEEAWPLARTEYCRLYLDAHTSTLSWQPPVRESLIRYKADNNQGHAAFTIAFDEDTEITGYLKLRLWIEADGADDADLFVQVRKLDAQGNFLSAPFTSMGYAGPDGRLRVSHRELDPERSTPWLPYHPHRSEVLLNPGQIVPVEIDIRPTGMFWHKGQQMRVIVAGYNTNEDIKAQLGMHIPKPITRNKGDHILYTGGRYDSYLLVPLIRA